MIIFGYYTSYPGNFTFYDFSTSSWFSWISKNAIVVRFNVKTFSKIHIKMKLLECQNTKVAEFKKETSIGPFGRSRHMICGISNAAFPYTWPTSLTVILAHFRNPVTGPRVVHMTEPIPNGPYHMDHIKKCNITKTFESLEIIFWDCPVDSDHLCKRPRTDMINVSLHVSLQ